MYAVIKTGGKQYTVKEGDVLKIELLPEDVGNEIQFKEVLMLADGDKIVCGSPLVDKATVKAEVLDHGRHKKLKLLSFVVASTTRNKWGTDNIIRKLKLLR